MNISEPSLKSRIWGRIKGFLVLVRARPIAQSLIAALVNLILLLSSVIGHFWVALSVIFFCTQIYITWVVSKAKLPKWKALSVGAAIVFVNIGVLYFTFIGQYWLMMSVALSLWQYFILIWVCIRRKAVA